MYKMQDVPQRGTVNGNAPIATLKDEYGGVYHIIIDDHCAVLVRETGGENDPETGPKYHGDVATHWFPEAIEAIKKMPTPRYA